MLTQIALAEFAAIIKLWLKFSSCSAFSKSSAHRPSWMCERMNRPVKIRLNTCRIASSFIFVSIFQIASHSQPLCDHVSSVECPSPTHDSSRRCTWTCGRSHGKSAPKLWTTLESCVKENHIRILHSKGTLRRHLQNESLKLIEMLCHRACRVERCLELLFQLHATYCIIRLVEVLQRVTCDFRRRRRDLV